MLLIFQHYLILVFIFHRFLGIREERKKGLAVVKQEETELTLYQMMESQHSMNFQ